MNSQHISTSPNHHLITTTSTHTSTVGSTQLNSENHLQHFPFSKQSPVDQLSANKRKVEEENNYRRSKKHKRADNTNAFGPLINSLCNIPVIGQLVETISAAANFILLPPHIRNKDSGTRNSNNFVDEMSQGQIPIIKHTYKSKKKKAEEAKRTLNTSSPRDIIFEQLQREPEMQNTNPTTTPSKTTTQQFQSPGLSPINGIKNAEAEMNGAWLKFLTTKASPDSKLHEQSTNDIQSTRRDWKNQLTVTARRKHNKRNSLDSSLTSYNDASSISFDLNEYSQLGLEPHNNNNSRMIDHDYEQSLIQAKQRLSTERKSIQQKLGKSRDSAIDLTDDTSFIAAKQERKRSNSESTLQQLQILLARNEHRKHVTAQEAEIREHAISQSLDKLRNAAAEKMKQDQAIINQIKRRTEAEKAVKKLTEEEEKIVELALDGDDDDEVLAEGFNMKVTRGDICRLRTPEWLNDEVINFYMNVLMDRNSKDPSSFPKIFIFNTFFFSMLEKGYERVKKWTRKVDIFSLDYLIIPVHLGVHWCLAAINFVEKRFEYYDSMGGPNKAALKAMRNYLVQEYKDKKKQQFDLAGWTDYMPRDIPQQQNGYDCGVFMCRYADCIAQNKAFTFKQKDMQTIRKRMILDILSKSYSG